MRLCEFFNLVQFVSYLTTPHHIASDQLTLYVSHPNPSLTPPNVTPAAKSQTIANRTALPETRAKKIKALLEGGKLDPDALDMDGKTLLHWAAFQGGVDSSFYSEEAQIAAALVVCACVRKYFSRSGRSGLGAAHVTHISLPTPVYRPKAPTWRSASLRVSRPFFTQRARVVSRCCASSSQEVPT